LAVFAVFVWHCLLSFVAKVVEVLKIKWDIARIDKFIVAKTFWGYP